MRQMRFWNYLTKIVRAIKNVSISDYEQSLMEKMEITNGKNRKLLQRSRKSQQISRSYKAGPMKNLEHTTRKFIH